MAHFDKISNYLDNQSLMLIQIIHLLNATPAISSSSPRAHSVIADGQTLADLFLAQSGSLDGLAASLVLQLSNQDTILAEIRTHVGTANAATGADVNVGLLTGKMDNISNTLTNIALMLTSLTEKSSAGPTLLGRLDNLDNATGNIAAANTSIAELLMAQAGSIDGLSTALGLPDTDEKAVLNEALQAIKIKLDAQLAPAEDAGTSGRLDNLDNAMGNITAMLSDITGKAGVETALVTRFDNLETAAGTIADANEKLAELLIAQAGSIDGLSVELNSFGSQAFVNFGEELHAIRVQYDTMTAAGVDGPAALRLDNLENAALNIAAMLSNLVEQTNGDSAKLSNLENALSNMSTVITKQSFNATMGNSLVNQVKTIGDNQQHLETLLKGLDSKLGREAKSEQSTEDQAQSDRTANNQALQLLAISAMGKRQDRSHSDIKFAAKQTDYKKARKGSFEARLKALKKLVPENYSKWFTLFENGRKAYSKDPHGSCAVWGQPYAEGFRNFCALNLEGRVLDIGSGPLGKPLYLQGYPSQFISAIEPLEVKSTVDFELARGFNEALPWPDKSFNCIVNSTSLDHVLSLEKALDETARVLCDDGRFIVWIGSVPGAKPYDAHNRDLRPIDDFHMFHIDMAWFEPYIDRWFHIEEKLELPTASFTHVYYVFSKR